MLPARISSPFFSSYTLCHSRSVLVHNVKHRGPMQMHSPQFLTQKARFYYIDHHSRRFPVAPRTNWKNPNFQTPNTQGPSFQTTFNAQNAYNARANFGRRFPNAYNNWNSLPGPGARVNWVNRGRANLPFRATAAQSANVSIPNRV